MTPPKTFMGRPVIQTTSLTPPDLPIIKVRSYSYNTFHCEVWRGDKLEQGGITVRADGTRLNITTEDGTPMFRVEFPAPDMVVKDNADTPIVKEM